MPTNRKGYYKEKREKIIEDMGGVCKRCGSPFNLEIHHKNGNNGLTESKGQLNRLVQWKKDIDNLELLCHDCHVYYHVLHDGEKKDET